MTTGPKAAGRRGIVSRLADLIVLLIGVVSVLAVAEMAVRPFYPAPPPLRSPQVRFRYSPRFGWDMVPDAGAWTFDRPAPINARGRRGPLHLAADSTAERWLVLGGGTAFGVGVDDDETFAQVAAALRSGSGSGPVEVINAACEGYDLGRNVRLLEEQGAGDAPKVVLVVVSPDDLPARGVRESVVTPGDFARVERGLNRQAPAHPGPLEQLRRQSRLVHFIDGRVRAFLRLEQRLPEAPVPGGGYESVRAIDVLLGRETPVLEAAWRTMEGEMDRLALAGRRLGATVYVVALPLPAQLRRSYARARYQSRLDRICIERGLLFVDPLPALREERRRTPRLYLPRLPYLSAAGHHVMAEQLVREMDIPPTARMGWTRPDPEGGEP